MSEIIRIEGLNKTFTSKQGEVVALDDIQLSIRQGEILGSLDSPEPVRVLWCAV